MQTLSACYNETSREGADNTRAALTKNSSFRELGIMAVLSLSIRARQLKTVVLSRQID
jgi:hypothetical protein